MTDEQIYQRGLEALKRELGIAGMVKFLQQLGPCEGDYTKERRKWVDKMTMEDIVPGFVKRTTKRKRRKAS